MKKITTILAAIACCTALTACGNTPANTPTESVSSEDVISDTAPRTDRYAGLELKKVGMMDRVCYENLSDLEESSHIAVVGTFIDDAEQKIEYQYNATFGKEIVTDFQSTNTIKVSKVLKGDDIEVGDELDIYQRYAVVDGKLMSFSDLTPMQKGDEWVFFLRKNFKTGQYICTSDSDSRFPTKKSASKNIRTALAEKPELGVYDERNFNQAVYDEIVAKYDV